jgi:membrane fusion protein (multidrug efflux system)
MENKKSKKIWFIIAAVIIIPIIWNQLALKISGIMQAKQMSLPTNVSTATVTEKEINQQVEYVGRIQTRQEVKIVSRINGWLQKQYYQDGDYVKKGQLLFQIEPDEYIIAVKNAEAVLRRAQASYDNSLIELNRAKELVKGDYVSRSYYDQAFAKYATDRATVDEAKADLAKKRLDLSYTKIYAPCDGKIGELLITVGNYVTAQTGDIAVLVTTNPVNANFTLNAKDLVALKNLTEREVFSKYDVNLKLADGTLYDEEGHLDFLDNMVNKDLGSITMRATFSNRQGKLVPNDFVRVVLTAKTKTSVTLVPQVAVLESVNGKYVWTIDENGCAKQTDIEVSGPYEQYWIVTSGLNVGDKVVATNIQSIRQGIKLKVTELSEQDIQAKAEAKKEATSSNMTDKPNQKKNKEAK